jgi:hypothetical protein
MKHGLSLQRWAGRGEGGEGDSYLCRNELFCSGLDAVRWHPTASKQQRLRYRKKSSSAFGTEEKVAPLSHRGRGRPPVASAAQHMRSASAAEAVADVVIYCFLGAMWTGNAVSDLMLLACLCHRLSPFRTKSFLILTKVH